jgi:hypothetical protein
MAHQFGAPPPKGRHSCREEAVSLPQASNAMKELRAVAQLDDPMISGWRHQESP